MFAPHVLEERVVVESLGGGVFDVPLFLVGDHHAPSLGAERAQAGGKQHPERLVAGRTAPGLHQQQLGLLRVQVAEGTREVDRGEATAEQDDAPLILEPGCELLRGQTPDPNRVRALDRGEPQRQREEHEERRCHGLSLRERRRLPMSAR